MVDTTRVIRLLSLSVGLGMILAPPPARAQELAYSTFLGGSQEEMAMGTAVDAAGNTWITGWTYSPDFPVTGAASGPRSIDIFVVKLDREGRLLWSTLIGGTDTDYGLAIDVDPSGHAYVAGTTTSRDFPQVRAVQGPSAGLADAVVFALSPSGDDFVYSTYLGGSDEDQAEAIAVDPRGQAYVTGRTYSADLPTVNAFQPEHAGSLDLHVTKLAARGESILYSTYLGGSDVEIRMAIAADARGNAYVAGETYSPDFPVVDALQPSLRGPADGFVAKIAPDGSGPVFSTFFGGSGNDAFQGIAIDPAGDLYLTGFTNSRDYPALRALQPDFRGVDFDAVVTRLTRDARSVAWSTYLGGSAWEWGEAIAVDARGAVYVTGFTYSPDFPLRHPLQPACVPMASGLCSIQAFLSQIAPDGSALLHSTHLGHGGGMAIDVDRRGTASIAGFAHPGFPACHAFQPEHGGGNFDGFVARVVPPRARR